MRLIDADKIPWTDLSDGKGLCIVTFADKVNQLPTAEPQIIYCKDCKNYKFGMCLYSMTSGVGKLPNGFCDWAEKREERA